MPAAMARAPLGETGLQISRIGFGAWALGGQWGRASDRESVAAIHRAAELGVNWIDTAPSYGHDHHSERVVGLALRGLRDRPYVFTKCGLTLEPSGELTPNLSAGAIRREVEGSLRRLGVDAIDLYQIHWRHPDRDIEEAWASLVELRQQGKVRHIGVANFDREQLERCRRIGRVETLQPPYSLLIRTPLWTAAFVDNVARESVEAELLPHCRDARIGVIVYSTLAYGLLSGTFTRERLAALPSDDWRRAEPDFREPNLGRILALVDRLRPIAAGCGCSLGELAIAWALANPCVTGAIVGFRRPEQVDELARAADLELTIDALRRIDLALAEAGTDREERP